MKTLVMIPAYNERDSILQTVADIKEHAPFADYVVINDCSTDGTKELLLAHGIPFLDLPINLGIGGGIQTGYRYAHENGYDIAVQFDGDGQHDATYLKALIEPIEGAEADMVIGSRFLKQGGYRSTPLRRVGIRYLSRLIRLLCGANVSDATSGLRAVGRRGISFFVEYYAQDYPEPESILSFARAGGRIIELPVEMRERKNGTSSIGPMRSVYFMIKVSLALLLAGLSFGERKKHD